MDLLEILDLDASHRKYVTPSNVFSMGLDVECFHCVTHYFRAVTAQGKRNFLVVKFSRQENTWNLRNLIKTQGLGQDRENTGNLDKTGKMNNF